MKTILYIGEKSGFSEQLSNYLIRDGIAVDFQNISENCTSRILGGLYCLVMIDTAFCADWILTVVQIRQASDIPIILAEDDRNQANAITAFKIGADDYLLKSIGVLEISLRIAALVRRCGANVDIEKKKKETIFKDLRIDEYSRTVWKNGKKVEVTKTEFELLLFLARHKGQVLTREQLCGSVWRDEYIADDKSVISHIHRLRMKIEDNPSEPRYILTVRGNGYRFSTEKTE